VQKTQLRQEHFSDSPFPVQVLCETDSTNNALKRMRHAPHGTVLVTGRQTDGRGRLGRRFSSPRAVSICLFCSDPMCLLPSFCI